MIRTGMRTDTMIVVDENQKTKAENVMSYDFGPTGINFAAPKGQEEVRSHRKGNTFVSVFG